MNNNQPGGVARKFTPSNKSKKDNEIKEQLKVLYEDKDILVCVKPATVLSQSDKSLDYDMVSRAKNYLAQKGEEPYVAIINRLDRPVRGITLFAKNKKAAAVLSKKMQEHDFGKYYKALVRTDCIINEEDKNKKSDGGRLVYNKPVTLTDYLLKDGKTNTSKVVDKNVKGAKKAVLTYVLNECDRPGIALADVELLTGRHHQIRVQMSHAGLPLVGDTKYGKSVESNVQAGDKKFVDVALCAYKMVIAHPTTGKEMTFEIDANM